MQHSTKLSNLMRLSWDIQRRKHTIRAKALRDAWVILKNEDITVQYLVKRHSTARSLHKPYAQDLLLFPVR